jgi:hypothetical protein
MFIPRLSPYVLAVALCLSPVRGHKRPRRAEHAGRQLIDSESISVNSVQTLVNGIASSAALVTVSVDDVTLKVNTTFAKATAVGEDAISAETIDSTALIIARDLTSAYSAYSGLNDYGIPYSILTVPSTGAALPSLNDSSTVGNYGLIVVVSEVSYDYGSDYESALTTDQWTTLFNYQVAFGVRMVRLDVYPSEDTGTVALGGCCDDGVEQYISISNDAAFPSAGLRTQVFPFPNLSSIQYP